MLGWRLSCCLSIIVVILSFFQIKADNKFTTMYNPTGIDTISYTKLGRLSAKHIIIEHDVDLKGKTCKLPKKSHLLFKGGIIKNGIIVGYQTALSCNGRAFKNIDIKGSWEVPLISTSFFDGLSNENALKNLFALASPNVKNTIIIEKGDYLVKALKNADACLRLPSNTNLFLYGTIRLAPNDFKNYSIIHAKGENINISGNGSIIGDRYSHTGTEGEWGMGVKFYGALNSSVTHITIRGCWGDCIYISGNSHNVLVEGCVLKDSRRQGISITKADDVTIRNCKISDISGTFPQYAIDIEPNKGDTIDNVLIEKVIATNCEGGFRATVGKKGIGNAWIGRVEIRNCHVSANSRFPIHLNRCKYGIVKRCTIETINDTPALYATYVNNLYAENNTINVENRVLPALKNIAKEIIGKGKYSPIRLTKTSDRHIKDNKVVEN